MTTVNLGEVWYAIARADSPALADRLIQDIQGMAIEIVEVDWTLARQAAVFKARGGISYADCFAAALAKLRRGEVITGDLVQTSGRGSQDRMAVTLFDGTYGSALRSSG